jgi:ribosomal protein L13E
LSQKPKKTTSAAKEPKADRQVAKKPGGHVPTAMVSSRHGANMILRAGKGFSRGEVEGAGVQFRQVRDWGLPVDFRRRSVLEYNVSSVKNWAAHTRPVEAPGGEVRKLEEEIVKVEKEVKKEVGKVKKEVKKVEKQVAEKVKEPVKSRGRKKSTSAKKPA